MTDLDEFRAARLRSVRGPRGPLALVNSEPVDHPQAVWPVQGEWAPATGGLTVTATPDQGVFVDDVLVDGTELAAGDDAIVPSSIRFASGMQATVARTDQGHALRVWDPASEAVQRFARIGTFPADPAWVLRGRFRQGDGTGDDASSLPFTVTDAAGVPLPVAGRLAFQYDGTDVDVVVVHAGPRLQMIFQDATSGDSTYSMGRFLFLDDPGADGAVDIDMNRAVLPPCAFSWQYACPIPPPENRLPFAVTAGETFGYDVDGNAIH